jgi:hypothetical protein
MTFDILVTGVLLLEWAFKSRWSSAATGGKGRVVAHQALPHWGKEYVNEDSFITKNVENFFGVFKPAYVLRLATSTALFEGIFIRLFARSGLASMRPSFCADSWPFLP